MEFFVILRARDIAHGISVYEAESTALRAQIGPDRHECAISDERNRACRVHLDKLT
jgi:hypothetical protein